MAGTLVSMQEWEKLAGVAHFNARRLAALCGVSLRQLQRQFRQHVGKAPQDWLNERRIVIAREMLSSGAAIKVVAIELGFKQASHFCRQFKSANQMTPSEFISSRTENGSGCRSGITSVAGG
jgi:AraC-like DNA-binding protein